MTQTSDNNHETLNRIRRLNQPMHQRIATVNAYISELEAERDELQDELAEALSDLSEALEIMHDLQGNLLLIARGTNFPLAPSLVRESRAFLKKFEVQHGD